MPTQDYEETANINSESSTRPYTSISVRERLADTRKTSPYFINDAFDRLQQTESNDTRIISIVRVSSTSVVKPKRLERVTKSVNEPKNYFNTVSTSNEMYASKKTTLTTNANETKFENAVTPFISLLRKNQFDVYENDPRELLDVSASSTSANYIGAVVKFSEKSVNANRKQDSTSRYEKNAFHRQSKSINDTYDSTEMATEQYTDAGPTETDGTERKEKSSSVYFHLYDEHDYVDQRVGTNEEVEKNYEQPEEVYGEPEKVYGQPEKVYGEPEKVYGKPEEVYGKAEKMYAESVDEESKTLEEKDNGEPEKTYEEDEKYKSETMHDDPETEFVKQGNHFGLGLPESSENSNSYSLFTTRVNDKKSSFIIDNGTHRKYRVEEKTPDGFIVGEYGMVSHRDGSLRGVRYTADSNINPSLIYQTLVKFLSLK